ncbi:MAG: hypothetical protein WC756_07845 [Taibaiella sp.]|jgi:hypothetical protein
MNRKNLLFVAGSCLLFLASCQGGKNPNIAGKWQATVIEVPTQDSMVKAQMKMQMEQIDALTTVDSGMIKRFGTADLETVKKMAKEEVSKQPDQMKEQMKEAAADFSFDLMKDGTAITFGKASSDTARWYFGDDGKKLLLDPFESKSKNGGMQGQQVMIFDIIHAGSDSLRLRVHQPVGQDVFVNLRPAKEGAKKAEEKK